MWKIATKDKKQITNNNPFAKCKEFQQDNKGLTLIELLIAMTISTVVIAMLILLMSAGSRNYSSANDEVKLQMAAQTLTNQLENVLIEAYWVEKQIINDQVTAYVIYSGNNICAVFYDNAKKMIYMKDGLAFSDLASLSTTSYTMEANLMASYITDFDLIISIPNNEVQMRVVFENKSADYVTEHTIALRNQMTTPVPTSVPG
jgi:prepilin-type N-terminal cleavage/methylation domain-containing protein